MSGRSIYFLTFLSGTNDVIWEKGMLIESQQLLSIINNNMNNRYDVTIRIVITLITNTRYVYKMFCEEIMNIYYI